MINLFMSLVLCLPFVSDNTHKSSHCKQHHKYYVWVVKYAGNPICAFNSLEEAECWCHKQVRKGTKQRWLLEIERKHKN